MVGAGCFGVPVAAGEGALGAPLARDAKLLGSQFAPPLLVIALDLFDGIADGGTYSVIVTSFVEASAGIVMSTRRSAVPMVTRR